MLLAQRKKWHASALYIHQLWARSFFFLIFIQYEISGTEKLRKNQQYVFCSNHFSFLDIPAFFLIHRAKFIGKSSISRIPLFGYFYKKIHILVDRSSAKSRGESLLMTKRAIDEGFNMTFFPEGGIFITPEEIPYMRPFKDGAFNLAVEKKVPLVPITMHYNYRILPDVKPMRFHRHVCKLTVHDPLFPVGESEDEMKQLKNRVFEIIQQELLAHGPEDSSCPSQKTALTSV